MKLESDENIYETSSEALKSVASTYGYYVKMLKEQMVGIEEKVAKLSDLEFLDVTSRAFGDRAVKVAKPRQITASTDPENPSFGRPDDQLLAVSKIYYYQDMDGLLKRRIKLPYEDCYLDRSDLPEKKGKHLVYLTQTHEEDSIWLETTFETPWGEKVATNISEDIYLVEIEGQEFEVQLDAHGNIICVIFWDYEKQYKEGVLEDCMQHECVLYQDDCLAPVIPERPVMTMQEEEPAQLNNGAVLYKNPRAGFKMPNSSFEERLSKALSSTLDQELVVLDTTFKCVQKLVRLYAELSHEK